MTVRLRKVIAIIDSEQANGSRWTREFLQIAASEGRLAEIPIETKAFIITDTTVYPSPISALTLTRRAMNGEVF